MVTDKKEAKIIPSDVATTLLARDYKGQSNRTTNIVVEARIKTVGNLGGGKTQSRTVYSPEGVSPTLTAAMGEKGNTMPYITVANNAKEISEPNYCGGGGTETPGSKV